MHARSPIWAFGLLCACASPTPVAPPVAVPPPAPVVVAPIAPAAAAHCEQVRDGNKLARIQQEVNSLLERLQSEPNYAWAKYEHFPCYRLVLAFTDGKPPTWLLAAASSELRPYFRFDSARLPLSHAQFEQARQEIFAALRPTGVKTLISIWRDAQRIDIGVPTEADAQLVRSVIPVRHRAITRVIPGGYSEPIPERS